MINKPKSQIIEMFVDFLKKQGAFVRYKKELNKEINDFLIKNDECNYFIVAFVWKDSLDGVRYWREIEYKWFKRINK